MLAEQDLAAVCKVVIKDREVLAALIPHGSAMVLETLHWPDEIRATDELDLPGDDIEVKPAERAMAAQLIAAMTGAFDPAEYRDEYRAALEQVIDAKVDGREIVEPEAPVAGGQLVDLMAMLEASVNAARTTKSNREVEAAAEAEAEAEAEADADGTGLATRRARPAAPRLADRRRPSSRSTRWRSATRRRARSPAARRPEPGTRPGAVRSVHRPLPPPRQSAHDPCPARRAAR